LTCEQKENILTARPTRRVFGKSPALNPQSDADALEAAADQAIAACGGNAREAVKALIVANGFLEADMERLKAAVSLGYARGKLVEAVKTVPPNRRDWYD
jgi:stage V sporulation protein SpoVS